MKHLHHIVPRHAGGSDDSYNLVCLTIEEHVQAHKLLYEQYGRWQDELAYKALSGQITNAEASLQANILANTGKYNSPETKLKKSLAIKSKPSNSKNYKWSEDQKNNLKKKNSGTAQSGRGGRCDSKLLGEYDGHGLVKISRSYARKTLWPAPGV